MKVIFYKAKYGDLLNKIIALWTLGKYSHCELVVKETELLYITYTSHIAYGGVVCRTISKTSDEWDVIDLSKFDLNKEKAVNFCKSQIGKGYDLKAIFLTFVIPFKKQDRKKWFCSEFVTEALKASGLNIDKKSFRIHPNKLYKILREIV
jgi:uncharacterized protein YycO